jgi:hypothetical protein
MLGTGLFMMGCASNTPRHDSRDGALHHGQAAAYLQDLWRHDGSKRDAPSVAEQVMTQRKLTSIVRAGMWRTLAPAKQSTTQQVEKEDHFMTTKNTFVRVIIAATQSIWIRPAVTTLAILATVLVVTGCDGSDDSGHRGGHRNQTHITGGNF